MTWTLVPVPMSPQSQLDWRQSPHSPADRWQVPSHSWLRYLHRGSAPGRHKGETGLGNADLRKRPQLYASAPPECDTMSGPCPLMIPTLPAGPISALGCWSGLQLTGTSQLGSQKGAPFFLVSTTCQTPDGTYVQDSWCHCNSQSHLSGEQAEAPRPKEAESKVQGSQ